jgi:hypothetical protein
MALGQQQPVIPGAGGQVMKMIEAVKMPQPRHAKILPQPQAASARRRPAAAEGPPILMVGGSAPPAGLWNGHPKGEDFVS